MSVDGQEKLYGFYYTEHVWAQTEDDAIKKAMARTREKLSLKLSAGASGARHFDLSVDEVTARVPLWKLLEEQGITFFPIGERTS